MMKLLDRHLKTRFSGMFTNYSKFRVVPSPQNKQKQKRKGKIRPPLPTVRSKTVLDRVTDTLEDSVSIKRYLQRCKRMSEKIKDRIFTLPYVIKRTSECYCGFKKYLKTFDSQLSPPMYVI